MEFKNFIEDYNKLSKKEKNFLENNKSRYYSRIHNIIEKSGLFNKTIKYHNEFRSKEKLRINYHSVTKEFRSEPYFLEKFWITLGKYNYVPEYNSLGKQIGVKPDKLVLGIKIHFHWIELHTHIVEVFFVCLPYRPCFSPKVACTGANTRTSQSACSEGMRAT